jgi:hypothetical protein
VHQVMSETGRVRFAGVVGEGEPDPRLRWREQARGMPVPVVGLVPQRHLEDWDAIGVGSGTRDGVLDSCEVSISYTLWRNPDEPDDPANLAELDQSQREAPEVEPPWPRPQWLVEQVRRMRYPMLWECVRTSWSRESRAPETVRSRLVAHVNHVLVNQFRQTRAVVLVGGIAREGFRIDTDPDVYGVGVDLAADAVLTAAIPRDALPYLEIAFAPRPL